MATALEAARIVSDLLVLVISVAAITVLVLVVKGKLTLPDGPPPRRWQVAAVILAVLLLGGVFLYLGSLARMDAIRQQVG